MDPYSGFYSGASEVASTFAQGFACGLQVGRESLLLCIGNTCELDKWDVHATVLHDDGVEFGAYGPPPRHNAHLQVVILDNDRSLSRITTGRYLG